jgi:hypothetical protein
VNPIFRLRRALIGRQRSSGTDFYDRATHVRRVPQGEMAIVEAALANGGPVADRLLRQLREAPDVWRLIADGGGYELRISTTDKLGVRGVPRSGWTSTWIPVVAAGDARRFELQVFVFEAGVVALLGRTLDGAMWPRDWRARPEDLERIRAKAPWLHLPTPADLRASRAAAAATIETWLGDGATLRGRRGAMHAGPPATDEAVAAFAAKEGFALPEAYASLVRVADGIEVGRLLVLGTRDAYRLDVPGPARLVIAPPDEDGVLTIAESGQVVWVDADDQATEGRIVGSDLRSWLVKQLTPKRNSTTAT